MDRSLNRQSGNISGVVISLVAVTVLLIGAGIFGVWAFTERQDYKNNSDEKAAAAAQASREETQAEDAAKYAEEAKNPLKTFAGPSAYGSLNMQYPKTWSGYVVQQGRGTPLDAFFHPDVVPDAGNDTNSFALRLQIIEDSYDRVLEEYAGQAENGEVKVVPYKLPKVESVVGSRIDGQIETGKQGSMVIFPVRNVTLKLWTEAEQYVPDFNNIILPNLSFSP